MAPAITGFRVT